MVNLLKGQAHEAGLVKVNNYVWINPDHLVSISDVTGHPAAIMSDIADVRRKS